MYNIIHRKMFRTQLDKAHRMVSCLRPNCVFVAVPWGMNPIARSWVEHFKGDYSVVNLDREFRGSLTDHIERMLEQGPVMVYGTPPADFMDLDDLIPVDYALIWIYPNKQTEYYDMIKRIPLGTDSQFIPNDAIKIWHRVLACPTTDTEQMTKLNKSLTLVCWKYQKTLLNTYSEAREDRVLVIVC